MQRVVNLFERSMDRVVDINSGNVAEESMIRRLTAGIHSNKAAKLELIAERFRYSSAVGRDGMKKTVSGQLMNFRFQCCQLPVKKSY